MMSMESEPTFDRRACLLSAKPPFVSGCVRSITLCTSGGSYA